MCRTQVFRAAAVAAVVFVVALPGRGGVRIVSEGVAVDRTRGSARFRLELDGIPDFRTVDEHGRPADSFQYEVDGDWKGGANFFPFEDLDAVVRGDEIIATGGRTLRIRAAGPDVEPDPDPRAGGWGRIRAAVPLEIDGPELSFEAPLSALGDRDGDGQFAYRVFTLEFGGMISLVESNTIPLPPAASAGLLTGAACVIFGAWRRRLRLMTKPD
jgi:hypothetical protein